MMVAEGYMSLKEAKAQLQVSYAKLREFVRLGLLHPEHDAFDKRFLVVTRAEVEELECNRKAPKNNRRAA